MTSTRDHMPVAARTDTRSRALVSITWPPCVAALLLMATLCAFYRPWDPTIERTQVVRADAAEYHMAAVNMVSTRTFSTFPPAAQLPDNYRPPLFPLLAASIYALAGIRPWLVLIANMLLTGVIVAMTTLLAAVVADAKCARAAAWLAALCPLLLINSMELTPDTLYCALLVISYVAWAKFFDTGRGLLLPAMALLLGCATLAKPVSLYLIAPVLLLSIVFKPSTMRLTRVAGCALAALVLYAAVLTPWIARTYRLYNRANFISYEGASFLNFSAANILVRELDSDLATVRGVSLSLLERQYDFSPLHPAVLERLDLVAPTVTPWHAQVVCSNAWPVVTPRIRVHNIAEASAAQRRLFLAILRRHWPAYIRYSFRGAAEILFTPPWQEFMRMVMPDVPALGFARAVLEGDVASLRRYGAVRSALALGAAGATLAYVAATVLLGIYGLACLLRRGRWRFVVGTVIVTAYFLGVAGPNAEARYRTSLVPLILVCAAAGLVALCQRARRR